MPGSYARMVMVPTLSAVRILWRMEHQRLFVGKVQSIHSRCGARCYAVPDSIVADDLLKVIY